MIWRLSLPITLTNQGHTKKLKWEIQASMTRKLSFALYVSVCLSRARFDNRKLLFVCLFVCESFFDETTIHTKTTKQFKLGNSSSVLLCNWGNCKSLKLYKEQLNNKANVCFVWFDCLNGCLLLYLSRAVQSLFFLAVVVGINFQAASSVLVCCCFAVIVIMMLLHDVCGACTHIAVCSGQNPEGGYAVTMTFVMIFFRQLWRHHDACSSAFSEESSRIPVAWLQFGQSVCQSAI